MYESLHNHTITSDGSQTYLEVLETAHEFGFKVVAFTDHDALPDEAGLKALAYYDGPVKWLLGCEISSGLPKELGGGPTGSLHVLGLFTDPDNEALREHCRRAQEARTERMEQMVANLQRVGLTISVKDCLAQSGGESVGRLHIATAILANEENGPVIDQMVADMAEAAKSDPAVAMHYMRLMERDRTDYPFQLFLSQDSFIQGVYVDYLYNVDFDDSVKLIRDAGGVAVIAHWFTIANSIDLAMLEGMLKDGRIDGIEIMGKPNNGDAQKAAPKLRELAAKTGCLATYGVDGHSFGQMRTFSSDRNLCDETIGQTQDLIKRFKPDLGWTNFEDGLK
ncbi:PHP domain-containing protein [Candidatus Saccharibacteria bacterium]|nr:PHP domain-containing protein [Candidatus Saccharibacteria bacterium]